MNKKQLIGIVINIKQNKTRTVAIKKRIKHSLYNKVLIKIKHYIVHDEINECLLGDLVLIEETIPISRHKTWKIKKVFKLS